VLDFVKVITFTTPIKEENNVFKPIVIEITVYYNRICASLEGGGAIG
jgi:hypothetical protein